MLKLHVHHVERDLYDRMPVDEELSQGTAWKTLALPEIDIVLFPAKAPVAPIARGYRRAEA